MQPFERGTEGDAGDDQRRVGCAHASACGGCPLLSLTYGEQRARKRERVREAFARYDALGSVTVGATEGVREIERYRTRAKFAVGAGGAIGLYEPDHGVTDIPGCRVVTERTAKALEQLRGILRDDRGGWALRVWADGGALRALDVRTARDPRRGDMGGESLQVTLVLERGRASREEARGACERLVSEGVCESAAVSWHDGRSPQLLGLGAEVLAGEVRLRDAVGEGRVWQHVAPGAFTQAHRGTAAAIHRWARERLAALVGPGRAGRVLELYAGSGALGLALAKEGAEVTLVESYALGAEAARSAAAAQGLAFVRVFAEDAARFARDEARSARQSGEEARGYDLALLNPPRRGVDRAVLEAVASMGPAGVLYVSCDPETLARDLATLAAEGYAVEGEARPFDMIPLTEEVETAVLVRRGKRPAPRVLARDERVLVCDGPSGIRGLARSWARARVEGWKGAVALGGADEDESGLVAIARSVQDAEALVREGALGAVACEVWVKSIPRAKGAITRAAGTVADARTRYHRAAVVGGHASLRVAIERGDTGTARVHLQAIGHPVLGDGARGDRGTNAFMRERMGLDRRALHVSSMEVRVGSEVQALQARASGDLALLAARLARRGSSGDGAG
jgi:23S rRNA (uracil1939-C5)-methyltransferase